MITSSIHPSALRFGDVFALPVKVGVFDKAPPPTWCKVVDLDLMRDGVQVHYERLDAPGALRAVTIGRTESVVLRRPDAVKRIAFAGASGTGKTTRAKAVAEALGLPICPIGSRSVAEAMGFASPYDVDAAGQRDAFQARLLSEKQQWEQEHAATGFVTDRTHYDNLAYTAMHCPDVLSAALLDDVIAFSSLYTSIVFCPMKVFWSLGEDSARVPRQGYHQMYEILVEGLLRRSDHRQDAVVVASSPDPQKLLRDMGWGQ